MTKQFFKIAALFPGDTREKVMSGFLGCDMVQREIIQIIKEGVNPEKIQVLVDAPGGPDVTKWQVNAALKRMGRKIF
jgi:hypothetical protein